MILKGLPHDLENSRRRRKREFLFETKTNVDIFDKGKQTLIVLSWKVPRSRVLVIDDPHRDGLNWLSQTTTKVIHECFGKQISVHLSITPRDVNAKYLRRLNLDPKDLHSLSGADNDFVLFHWFFGDQFRFHMLRADDNSVVFASPIETAASCLFFFGREIRGQNLFHAGVTLLIKKNPEISLAVFVGFFGVYCFVAFFSYAIRSSRVASQAPLNNIKETRTPSISYSFSKYSESDRSQLKNIEQAFLLEIKLKVNLRKSYITK